MTPEFQSNYKYEWILDKLNKERPDDAQNQQVIDILKFEDDEPNSLHLKQCTAFDRKKSKLSGIGTKCYRIHSKQ